MRDKKSQTATEYLIILAVVIVIALIVVGVLGGIPSIGGSTATSANDAKLKTSKIAVVSHSVTNEGTKVVVRNNQADTVKVRALDINGTSCSSTDLPAILPAGISKEVLCTNINSSIREDVFEFPLIINYTDTKTNSDYVLDDDLKLIGRVGHVGSAQIIIWAESILSTTEITFTTENGPSLSISDCYGSSVTNLGDLDEDGVVDIAVGAYLNGAEDEGAVHIHFLNSSGGIKSTVEINNATANGPNLETSDYYGNSIANIGDLDGDGVTDIAVGSKGDDDGGNRKGAVHIHFMNSDGSVKSTVKINDTTSNGPVLENSDNYGSSITSLGDLDGDGVVDIAVGAYGDGAGLVEKGGVHIHFMNSDGSINSTVQINDTTVNGPSLGNNDWYGNSIANIGDLDGDGVVDIAVGANGDGVIYIHFMDSDGSVKSTVEINGGTLNGPDNPFIYGSSVTSLGDLDGDDVVDIAVGSYLNAGGGTNRGAIYISFLNSDGSVKSTVEINDSTLNGPNLNNNDYYGWSITNLGDLDGNSVVDFVAGAIISSSRGKIYIHYLNSTLW